MADYNSRPLEVIKKNQSNTRDKKSSHREMVEYTSRRVEDDYSSSGSRSNRNRLLDPKDILSNNNKETQPKSKVY